MSNNLKSVVEQKQTVRTDLTHTEPVSSFFHIKLITEFSEIEAQINPFLVQLMHLYSLLKQD